MAAFQIEVDSCTGRSFAASGYLGKFKTWVVKSPASGGPGWYIHDDQSSGSNPYIVITQGSSPSVNEVYPYLRIGYLDSGMAGYIYVIGYLWWDNSTQTGYGKYSDYWVNTLDSASFVYRFSGGEESMFLQSYGNFGSGNTWQTAVWTTWTRLTGFTEASTVRGVLQSGVTAGSSVDVTLDTGQGSLFTVGNYYFLYDFDGHTWCDYCLVENISSDVVTLDTVTQDFPSGAILCAYDHNYAATGSTVNSWHFNDEKRVTIPYYGYQGGTGTIYDGSGDFYGHCSMSADDYAVGQTTTTAITEKGEYIASQLLIKESSVPNSYTVDSGIIRGTLNNMYTARRDVLPFSQGTDGITIDGNNYLYFHGPGTLTARSNLSQTYYGILFLDTESVS